MRRISLFIAALGMLVPTSTVLATPGCGEGWEMVTVSDALARVDDRIYDEAEWEQIVALVESIDANADTMLCIKQHKPNQGQDKQWIGPEDGPISDYVVTMVNDNSPKGKAS